MKIPKDTKLRISPALGHKWLYPNDFGILQNILIIVKNLTDRKK